MRSAKTHAQKSILSELAFSIPISLICTHLMMGSTEDNYPELFRQKGYLLRIIPKTILTLLLILLTKLITRYLDVKMPWHKGRWSRSFLQIFYGMLSVVLFDFVASAVYLDLNGIHISDTRYFGFHLPSVCIYVVLLNGWYTYQHFLPHQEISIARETEPAEKESLEVQLENIRTYCLKKKIVFIARRNKFLIAKIIDGECIVWNNALNESITALSEADFFMVSRAHIVHRSIIAELKEEPEEHKLSIILKPPFNDKIDISESRHMAFRQWWDQD